MQFKQALSVPILCALATTISAARPSSPEEHYQEKMYPLSDMDSEQTINGCLVCIFAGSFKPSRTLGDCLGAKCIKFHQSDYITGIRVSVGETCNDVRLGRTLTSWSVRVNPSEC